LRFLRVDQHEMCPAPHWTCVIASTSICTWKLGRLQSETGITIQASLARVMGLPSEGGTGSLQDKRMLLVLDARHRKGIGSEVASFLEACPNGSVIVASQTELGVEGEAVFAL
jgi:hypothetical protein